MTFTYCPSCGKQGTVQKQNDTDYECGSCQWHFWNNAKAAVGAVLVRDDGKILLVVRDREPQKGKYCMPGGFVDFGEDALTAIKREAMEEIGVIITSAEIIGTYSNIYNPGVSTTDIIFVVREWEGEIRINDADEISQLEWKPVETIESDDFAWNYPGFVQHFKNIYNTNHAVS
jgi:ADP-ribose pyrophosphatase YjhB (NUDIX family)